MMEVKYILEVVIGDEVDRAIAMPLVNTFEVQRIPTDRIRWTLGPDPIIEHSGIRAHRIVAAGDSGQNFRHGYNADGERMFATGPELFKEFQRFLEDYETEVFNKQQSGASVKRPMRLVLRALWEDQAWRVEQTTFAYQRSVQHGPFSYTWNIELMAYAFDVSKLTGDLYQQALAQSPFKAAARAIDSATAYTEVTTEQLQSVRGRLDEVREPIKAAARMADQVSRIASAAQSIGTWPRDLVADLYSVTEASTRAVFDSWAAAPLIDRNSVRSLMFDVLGPMAEMRRESLTWLGLNFIDVRGLEDPSAGSASYTSTLSSRLARARSVVPYQVSAGQDVGGLAQDVIGDRTQWPEITRLNATADPHTTAEGRPLGPGETVLVPSPSGEVLSTSDPTDVYGTDLLLGPDGDLVLEGTEDVATVSGIANLRQAIYMRAKTVQGTNVVFPEVGLPDSIGNGIYAETAGLMASQARSQFGSDHRIEKVTELTVDDSLGDRLIVSALLKPVASAAFRVSVPISQGA